MTELSLKDPSPENWPYDDETKQGKQYPIEDVKEYKLNAKKHSDEQVRQLADIMAKTGVRTRILIDGNTNEIIAGHGRFAALKSLGFDSVPVDVIKDLPPERIKALRLVDNQVVSMQYDYDMLSEELQNIHEDMGFDMTGWFSEKEIQFAVEDLAEMGDDSLTDDLAGEVSSKSEETANRLDELDTGMTPVSKVLGFSQIDANSARTLRLFMGHCESMTGLKGGDALAAYARSELGVL